MPPGVRKGTRWGQCCPERGTGEAQPTERRCVCREAVATTVRQNLCITLCASSEVGWPGPSRGVRAVQCQATIRQSMITMRGQLKRVEELCQV